MPVGFRIASAWVDIRAEDKGLRQQIKDAVEKAARGQEAKIELKIDSKGLRREVQDALKEATKGQKPMVEIAIKSTGLRKEVTDALKRATDKQKPAVKLSIKSAGLRREVQNALNEATKNQKPTVRLSISSVGLRREVQRALNEATVGQDGEVKVHIRVDRDGLTRAVRDLADTHPTITPHVDGRALRQSLMASLRNLRINDDIHINPNIDGDLLQRQIQSEIGRLRDKFRVRITPDVDTDTFAARIRAAARTVAGDIDIDLNPRVNSLKARGEVIAALHGIAGTVPIHFDLDQIRLAAQIKAAVAALNAMPHNLRFRAKLDVDTAAAQAKMMALALQMRLINQFLGHGVAGFHAWTGAAIAMGSVVAPLLGSIIPMLKDIGTSSAIAVPLLTMASTVIATLFMGMGHIGKVAGGIFNASVTDVKNLNEELSMLSPNARDFANVLRDVQNAWSTMRKTVQDQLFQGADEALREFTNTILPTLTVGLSGTSMQLNRMALGMLAVTKSAVRSGELAKTFGAIQIAMEPLVPIPGQFLNMLMKMTMAAGPLLTRMLTSFQGWASKMTEKLNASFAAGTLQAAISKAGDDIVNFFKRIANNPTWDTFVARMTSAGPRMAEVLGHVAEAILKLLNAAAPFGTAIMGIVDAFAQFINWIPTDFLTMFLTKLMLINIAFKAAAWIMGLTRALAGLRLVLAALGSQQAMVAILNTSTALSTMGATAGTISKLATAIRYVGTASIALAALWGAKELIDHFAESNVAAAPDVDKLQQAIMRLVKTGQSAGEFKKAFGDIGGLSEGFKTLNKGIKENIGGWEHLMGGTKVSDWTRKVIDNFEHGDKSIESWNKKIGSLDKALAELVGSGHGDIAAAFIAKTGISAKNSKKYLTDYNKAVVSAKLAQQLAALTMGQYGQKALEVQAALDSQKQAAEGLRQSIEALNDAHRKAMGGEIAMEQSIDDATTAFQNNGRTLDINTQKGRDNKKALLDLASATSEAGMAKLEETGSWTQSMAIYDRGRTQLVKLAQQMGMNSTEAKRFADRILQIPDKTVSITADYTSLDQKIVDAQAKIDDLKQRSKVAVGADKTALDAQVKAAQKELNDLKQQRDVMVDADIASLTAEINAAQKKIDDLKQKRKTAVGADKAKLDAEITAAQKKVDSLRQKRAAIVQIKDLVTRGVATAQNMIDALKGKTVLVNVKINGQITGVDPTKYYSQGPHAMGGPIHRASGGAIPAFMGTGGVFGPGGPTSDLIHAMLSNGEYVVRAASVKKYGMGFMNMLNRGMMPKPGFAAGGAVKKYAGGGAAGGGGTSGTLATALVKITANTVDIDGKIRKTEAALVKLKAPKGVIIKASDGTAKAIALANAHFRSIPATATASYGKITTSTAAFNNRLVGQFNSLKGKNAAVWKSVGSSLQTSVTNAFSKVKVATSTFSAGTVSAVSGIRTKTAAQWNALGNSLTTSTNKMYSGVRGATNTFGSQNVAKFKSISNATGAAWGTLGPKFKPPVSYLIHTVLNSGMVGAMNAMMSKLGGGKKVGGVSVAGFARGGPIYGEGTATSDSIPARLSHGEYVIQAKAVKKFGTGFFNQVNQGSMPGQGAGYKPGFATGGLVNIRMAPGFATGGAVPSADTLNKIMGDGGTAGSKRMTDFIMNNYVLPLIDSGPGGSAMKAVQKAGMNHIRGNVQSFIKDNFGGAGSAAAGLRWAKTQYGKKYQWGGNGNPSWDCSGFMSAIESVIRGEKPHRRWATGAFGSSGPSGWKRNAKAPFQIGITNAGVGHTAGTIGKENVESSGGIGVHGGVGVPRGANDGLFTSRWGYVGPNATKKAFGGYISGPGGPTSDAVPAMLSNGEYVIRAAAVKRMGTGYLNALNSGALRGFASGGSTSSTTYKVKSGDTLSEIAAKFHTTVSILMSLNKSIKNANQIYSGQTIVLKKVASNTKKSTSAKAKAAAAAKSPIQDAGAASALKNAVTLREAEAIANHLGVSFKADVVSGLSAQGSVQDLVANLTTVKSQIFDAFKGKTQDALAKKFTSTANKLIPLQIKLDKVTASLETAKGALDDLKGKFDSMKESVSSAIKDFASVTKIGQYGTSPTTLLTQLQKDADKANQFNTMLTQLKAKGVNGDVIGQIANAGISGGGIATAQTILNMTPEQLAQLNSLEKQINTAADNAGSVAASGMYQAGINAAQGLVDGLASQQKAIEKQMLAIAQAMQDAIRKALGIKSPSRVMMQLANYTADGLENQLAVRTPGIARTMEAMVMPPKVTAPAVPTSAAGTIGNGSSGTSVHIENINVNITGNIDLTNPIERRRVATTLARDIKEAIRKDDKAHK